MVGSSMSRIEIDYSKLCPYLVNISAKQKPYIVNLETDLGEDDFCDVGYHGLQHTVESDLMLKPKRVRVNVACPGCTLQKGGFSKTVEAIAKK
jgi:hypothetical protein